MIFESRQGKTYFLLISPSKILIHFKVCNKILLLLLKIYDRDKYVSFDLCIREVLVESDWEISPTVPSGNEVGVHVCMSTSFYVSKEYVCICTWVCVCALVFAYGSCFAFDLNLFFYFLCLILCFVIVFIIITSYAILRCNCMRIN